MNGYNWVYKELVKDENDLTGAIAYSLYKRQKIEYINQCTEETGKPPTDEQLAEFHRISSSTTSLEGYRLKADMLMSGLLQFATESIIDDLQNQNKEVIYKELQTLLSPIETEIAKKKSFKAMALEAMISVFGTIIVIILVGFLLKGYQWISSFNPLP